ncbi:MAG: hypothetical protein LBF91_09225 [Azoarcus sp.]|jgi:hypothetical protein|nr:hypothetical protein [Azoarcus sp.]
MQEKIRIVPHRLAAIGLHLTPMFAQILEHFTVHIIPDLCVFQCIAFVSNVPIVEAPRYLHGIVSARECRQIQG